MAVQNTLIIILASWHIFCHLSFKILDLSNFSFALHELFKQMPLTLQLTADLCVLFQFIVGQLFELTQLMQQK